MTDTTALHTGIDADREAVRASGLKVGRISFLNMFPMHWSLGVDMAFSGVPTALNRALLDGTVDVACISSIEYARHADELVLLPSLCIASEGAVGSIFAIAGEPLERVREWHVTQASATSVALLESLARLRGATPKIVPLEGAPADALGAPGVGVLLIGDEALHARGDAALGAYEFTDLGERWLGETGLPMVYAVWAMRRGFAEREPDAAAALDRLLVHAVRQFGVSPQGVVDAAHEHGIDEHAARVYFEKLCYGFGARERKGLVRFLRMSHEYGLLEQVPSPEFVTVPDAEVDADAHAPHVGELLSLATTMVEGPVDDAARERMRELYGAAVGTSAALKERPEDVEAAQLAIGIEEAARDVDVDTVLDKALRDERIDEVEATSLLLSRRLLDVGQVAHELRLRRTPHDVVTFIVDRNINYTNLCVTDCGFCAFFRRPGDALEGYLLEAPVILDKIQETIDLGGTAALLQGGHNPDLDIEWYVDLFRTIKQTYPSFHLHALSPPEIQHIARRSKLSVGEVLAQLRDAGLDSLPGGGGEILVDRVRRIIAPKKTKGADWIGIMREAQRVGMSTTATMMYGHAELLAERVLHMKMVRDLQDETRGFRAFISWTFQHGQTPLSKLIQSGAVPYADRLPVEQSTPWHYLLTQAVSRIYLDNVDNIQSSWVTQGMKVGQVALDFGANDMGSIMIEENVVSSAGTTYRASVDDFVHAISAQGMRAVQRDTLYRTVSEHTL